MALLLCFCCGRQREVKPLKKGIVYSCSNCGAKEVIKVRTRLHFISHWDWSDKDGTDPHEARYNLYRELKRVAEVKGYPRGWIAHKFKAVIGEWPNGEAMGSSTPASAGLLWWIKQQNAAFKKRMRDQELRLADVGSGLPMRDNTDVGTATSILMSEDDWGVEL